MKYQIHAFIITVLILISCSSGEIRLAELSEVNAVSIEPGPNNYGLKIRLSGVVDCPCRLTILQDGDPTNQVYDLDGKIKAKYSGDWYGNRLSFDLSPQHCAGKGRIKIKMLE